MDCPSGIFIFHRAISRAVRKAPCENVHAPASLCLFTFIRIMPLPQPDRRTRENISIYMEAAAILIFVVSLSEQCPFIRTA